MEVSYCTFGFVAVIRHDLLTLLLPRDSSRDNIYVRDLSPRRKGNSRLKKLLEGLNYEKIRTWRQDGHHNRFPV